MVHHYITLLLVAGLLISCARENQREQKAKEGIEDESNPNTVLRLETDIQDIKLFDCDYLNQEKPGDIPVKFMPDVICTKADESCFEISPSGKEIMFNRDYDIYMISQDEKGKWSEPVLFLKQSGENSFSKDGSKIFFNSRAPLPGAKVPLNVWVVEKKDKKWGKPFYLGGALAEQTVHAPTVSAMDNIYASGILCSEWIDSTYSKPRKLTPNIKGTHPFITADERFLIFDKRPPGGGHGADLYITFRKPDSTWTEPVSVGKEINTDKLETNAYVTPDKQYMFFTRKFDIYWVKADFIDKIRKQFL